VEVFMKKTINSFLLSIFTLLLVSSAAFAGCTAPSGSNYLFPEPMKCTPHKKHLGNSFGNKINSLVATKNFSFVVDNYNAYNGLNDEAVIPTGTGYWSVGQKQKITSLLFIFQK